MRVILFRHGPAGDRDPARWPDDRERPLTTRGEERTRVAANGLHRIEREVAAVLTSPLVRADQTAKILSTILAAKVEALPALAPGGTTRGVIDALSRFRAQDTVVLVGHEPELGVLAGAFVQGPHAALPLKKAGACAITFEGAIRSGSGRLQWFLPPRVLRRLAGKRSKV